MFFCCLALADAAAVRRVRLPACRRALRVPGETEEEEKMSESIGGFKFGITSGQATHLGDGAYISEDPSGFGGFVVTANHHDPNSATDRVYIDAQAAERLVQFIADRQRGGGR